MQLIASILLDFTVYANSTHDLKIDDQRFKLGPKLL